MKLLTIRLFVFVIPILITISLFEYFLREIPNDYSYKNSYLENHAEDIEVLILGNSHAYRGVIPEKLNLKGFNAAYISQTLDLDFLVFDKFKMNLINLEFLVINISYPSLFGSLKESKESWRLKNYNIYYGLNNTFDPINYLEILSNKYAVNKMKLFDYYKNNISLRNCSTLGAGILNIKKDVGVSAEKATLRHTTKGFPHHKEYIKQLDKVIQFTNKNNIKIIFVTTPAYKKYVDYLNKKQLNKMNTVLDSIVENNNAVFRLNLLESKDYNLNDFVDGDHLNKNGAIKLTSDINNFIENLNK